MDNALSQLADTSEIYIKQMKEWGEILTGWETRNRYEISNGRGEPLFLAGEVDTSFLSRHFLGSMRPFTIEVRDKQGNIVLTIRRPWRWFFASVEIFDAKGQKLGGVQRRWQWLTRRYDLHDENNQTVAILHGPLLRPWTFRIMIDGRESGKITKKWVGLLKESFTTADTFGVQFDTDIEDWFRAICLGATFLIDFVHFEKRKR